MYLCIVKYIEMYLCIVKYIEMYTNRDVSRRIPIDGKKHGSFHLPRAGTSY